MENRPVGLPAGLLTFFAIVFIRNQLELLLESDHLVAISLTTQTVLADYVHVLAAWAYIYLASVCVLATVGKRGWLPACRLSLIGLPLIWLPPLIDGLTGNSGAIIYQYDFAHFGSSFAGLFLPWIEVQYVTLGVRIEVFCVMLLSGTYIFCTASGKFRLLRAFFCALLIYLAIFSMGFLPACYAWVTGHSHQALLAFSVLGVTPTTAPTLWYLLPVSIMGGLVWCKTSAPHSQVLLASLRLERMATYLLFFMAGFYAANHEALVGNDWLNPYDILFIALHLLSIGLAFVAMTALNDVCDTHIDGISNPQRLLVTTPALLPVYRCTFIFGSVLALGLSLVCTIVHPLLVLCMLSLGTIYSLPPLRLRRLIFIAPLNLTLIAATCYLAGMAVIWQNATAQHIMQTPFFLLLGLFFIGCQLKDIKDIDGDRTQGVVTLATLLGARLTYHLLCSALAGLFILGIVTHQVPLTIPVVVAGLIFVVAWASALNSERMIVGLSVCFLLVVASDAVG